MNEHSDLNRRLADAANSEEFTFPDLRPAARSARRRRSALITGGAALTAAALTGTAFIVLQNQATQVALPPASPTASAPAAPASHSPASPSAVESDVLDHAIIAARCAPQMAKFNALYPDADGEWAVLHPHEYREGDVVRLGIPPSGDQPADALVAEGLCIIPSEADVSTPVPMSALLPDPKNEAGLLASCSEALQTEQPGTAEITYGTPDLRTEGQLVAVETAGVDGDHFGQVIYVAAETDAALYTCLLSATEAHGTPSIATEVTKPVDTEAGPTFHWMHVGEGNAAQTYLFGSGPIMDDAAEIYFPDSSVTRIPVTNGRLHAVEVLPGHPNLDFFSVLNARGEIVLDSAAPWDTAPQSPEVVLEACQARVDSAELDFGDELKGVDLTTGTIVATSRDEDLARVLIQHGDTQFTCDLGRGLNGLEWSSPTIDPTLNAADWDKAPGYTVWLDADSGLVQGTVYLGHGSLPADAKTIEFDGALSTTVELTPGEPWALVARVKDATGPGKVTYKVLAADGKVLHEGIAIEI